MEFKAAAGEEHQRLLRALISYLTSPDGGSRTVTHADGIAGYPDTPTLKNYKPDLVAQKGGRLGALTAYGEAKVCEDVENDHTLGQLKEFSNYVMTNTNEKVPCFLNRAQTLRGDRNRVLQAQHSSERDSNSVRVGVGGGAAHH